MASRSGAIDGRGGAVETPGGWTDFMRQNPGFFDRPEAAAARPGPKPEAKPAPPPPPKPGKLSYKDARRLAEIEAGMPKLQAEIEMHDAALHDPDLYARDPKGFDRIMKASTDARATLAAMEEEWLELEEKRAG